MKNTRFLLALALAGLLSACGTLGQAYVKQHPELSAAHRQILLTGKIPDGDAVAGMTREQIQIVMGVDATQYTTLATAIWRTKPPPNPRKASSP